MLRFSSILSLAVTAALASQSSQSSQNEGTKQPTQTLAKQATATETTAKSNEIQLDMYSTEAVRQIKLRQQLMNNAKASQSEVEKDPWQPFNRVMFNMNDYLDTNLIKPVTVKYDETVPTPAKKSVSNFFSNLKQPWTSVNLVMQRKPKSALKSLGRFTLNTITTLGLADTAGELDLHVNNEGFSDTLAVWGVPSGPYLVLPLMGPSTVRDGFGTMFELPIGLTSHVDSTPAKMAISSLGVINLRAGLLQAEGLFQAGGDKYSLIRDSYLQFRQFNINEKLGIDQTDSSFLDEDFGDEDEFADSPISGSEEI